MTARIIREYLQGESEVVAELEKAPNQSMYTFASEVQQRMNLLRHIENEACYIPRLAHWYIVINIPSTINQHPVFILTRGDNEPDENSEILD